MYKHRYNNFRFNLWRKHHFVLRYYIVTNKTGNVHITYTEAPTCNNCCRGRSVSIARAERDGTRAETRLLLSPKQTSPFKSVGVSVQSTAGSRGVCISLSNAG